MAQIQPIVRKLMTISGRQRAHFVVYCPQEREEAPGELRRPTGEGESDMGDLTPLGQYLVDLVGRQNLSLREASMRAGLAPDTISKILRRGETSTPRPQTLQLLADGLGGNFDYMMHLAGHAPLPEEGADPELVATANRLIEIWQVLRRIDPDRAQELERIAVMQAEMVLAAARSRQRREETEREPTDNTTAAS